MGKFYAFRPIGENLFDVLGLLRRHEILLRSRDRSSEPYMIASRKKCLSKIMVGWTFDPEIKHERVSPKRYHLPQDDRHAKIRILGILFDAFSFVTNF